MDKIRIPIDQLMEEPKACNGHDRYSHPSFTCKMPKGITMVDFDKSEKLIEIEFSDGKRSWVPIKEFFGEVISEATDILMLYPDEDTESMSLVNVECFRIKRTMYWKLIFERDLPF